jgi:hypothetical protein
VSERVSDVSPTLQGVLIYQCRASRGSRNQSRRPALGSAGTASSPPRSSPSLSITATKGRRAERVYPRRHFGAVPHPPCYHFSLYYRRDEDCNDHNDAFKSAHHIQPILILIDPPEQLAAVELMDGRVPSTSTHQSNARSVHFCVPPDTGSLPFSPLYTFSLLFQ